MTITISLATENSGFVDDREGEILVCIQRAIHKIRINEFRPQKEVIQDTDGNTVGTVTVEGK